MKASSFVLSSFSPLLKARLDAIATIGEHILIPIFPKELVLSLIEETITALSSFPVVVPISSPVTVIGDLHGNVHDLVRIIVTNGPPPQTEYLLLGDYIDRGDYSLEVAVLLLSLFCQFPSKVTLLRGNHEQPEVNKEYGFRDSIISIYNDDDVWVAFNKAFAYFPLAATLFDRYFCVHGGISANLESIEDIAKIKKPIADFSNMVEDLLWSDPAEIDVDFEESRRGVGHYFGKIATDRFLEKFHFEKIIRGHENVTTGIDTKHDSKVLTVFSTSNYASTGNVCAFLCVSPELGVNFMAPITPLPRSHAMFRHLQMPNASGPKNMKISSPSLRVNVNARRSVFSRKTQNDAISPSKIGTITFN